jgi:radical SAM protein with 4Fe4S-binding SPASM domain
MSHTYNISLASLKNSLKPKADKLPMFERTQESISKFKAGDITFFYDNYTNGIYNENMDPLSQVTEPDAVYENVIKEVRSRVKSNKPFWIRILLGHACNYDCDYCMQKDIGNPDEREKITTTDKFIEQLSKLDLSRLEKIDLWGGETLLYWKTMVDIMTKFDREGLVWFIPTNGTPLQMKHIEFFKTLKGEVTIGLSHDGPGHERLRGEEFLHKKVEVLKAAQETNNIKFSFNPVLSRTNFDLIEINNFFYKFAFDNNLDMKKLAIAWVLGHNHDYENISGSATHVIGGEALDKFKQALDEYMELNIQKMNGAPTTILNNSLFDGGMGALPYIKTLQKQILPTNTTSCGVDDEGVLSLDMKGNVRTCPHTDETFIGGHIEELEKVKLKRVDLERYENHCRSCEVFRLCKSNCPIEVPDEVFYTNCAVEKVYNRAIQNTAFRLIFGNKPVKQ